MPVVLQSDKTFEVGGIQFTVRPAQYSDLLEDLQFRDGKLDSASLRADALLRSFMRRVTEWEGVASENGEALPCDEAGKFALFGQYPDILFQLKKAVDDREASASKNFETMPNGSDAMTETCADPAGG